MCAPAAARRLTPRSLPAPGCSYVMVKLAPLDPCLTAVSRSTRTLRTLNPNEKKRETSF